MNCKQLSLLLALVWTIYNFGYVSPVNLLVPYDTLIRPEYYGHHGWQLFAHVETGFADARGYNFDSDKGDVLQLWQCDQNALAMLDGVESNSSIGQLRTRLGAIDDGTRGHLIFSGELKNEFSISLAGRVNWCSRGWSLAAYLPIYGYELKDVSFQDKTNNITDDDVRIKELLTNEIVSVASQLGNGLELTGWKRRGVGDLAILAEWHRDFVQRKDFLKKVGISFRSGILFPSGKTTDPDKLFAFPFGCDGAFAIPFGLGIDLYLGYIFRAGVDVQLTHTFGTTKCRRIKTAENQTDLLFLHKVQSHKDFGLTQRFNLYAEFYKFCGGLSVLFGYQFIKHGEDEVYLKTTNFSTEIANSAESLQEWTMHHVIAKTTYDFGVHMSPDSCAFPQLAVVARLPFNGKRIAVVPSIGVTFAIDF